jgi:hypothetical protein
MVPGGQQQAPAGGGPGGGASNQRNPRLIALIAGIGALVLVLCVGGGVVLANFLSDDDKPTGNPTATSTTSAAPTGPTELVDCEGMRGKPFTGVRNHLENVDGFRVKETPVDDSSRAGTVVDVSPCGQQPKGSEIEVKVSNGKGTAGGGPSGGTNPTCNGGGFPFGCQSRR